MNGELLGVGLASMAKHCPEQLLAHADTVRQAGRKLEMFENANVIRIERLDEGGFRVTLETDSPDCWYW